MAMPTGSLQGLTVEQFFALADVLPPTAQLIEGEVVVDGPAWKHQHAAGELYHRLRQWIDAAPGRGQCGIPLTTRIDGCNAYQPDVWWLAERHMLLPDEVRHMAPPDLAVEVLSPSTRRLDVGVKRLRYEENGLPELWIVDPRRRTATVLRRSSASAPTFDVDKALGADDVLESPQLPGFAVPVGSLLLP
jgi:Uma2 family endonuclease